jgi:hypothetical protein
MQLLPCTIPLMTVQREAELLFLSFLVLGAAYFFNV